MAPSKIQITAPETPILQCDSVPQLMPFHVAYSGPAPLSTFFRVRELEDENRRPSIASIRKDSCIQNVENSCEEKEGCNEEGKGKGKQGGKLKRLVAAFRGRRVVGTEVPIPEGYVGLVLRSDAAGKVALSKEEPLNGNGKKVDRKVNGKTNGGRTRARSTRRSRRNEMIEVSSDNDEAQSDVMDLDETDPSLTLDGGTGGAEVRKLKATETFQSLVVWNADVAVDEGRDEYIRALREWTTLAAEVHRMED